MANADGYVLPKPGIPKTLGILNVIFGVLLLLGGLCGLVGTIAAPALMKFSEKTVKDAQAKIEAQQKEQLKGLDDREKAAKTDEEKKAIEQERASVIAGQVNAPKIDMSAATDVLDDPTIMGFSYIEMGIGLILNVLLLVSGILLIRLSPSGKSLAVWWAGLSILATVILAVGNLVVVQPANKPHTEKAIAKLEEQAKGKPPGSIEASTLQWTKMTAGLAVPMVVGKGVLSMIYPAIVLILLNTAGARAALLAKRPTTPEGF